MVRTRVNGKFSKETPDNSDNGKNLNYFYNELNVVGPNFSIVKFLKLLLGLFLFSPWIFTWYRNGISFSVSDSINKFYEEKFTINNCITPPSPGLDLTNIPNPANKTTF